MTRMKALLFALLLGPAFPAAAAGIPVKLYKNPNCGCCNTYIDYLRSNGFQVEAINTVDIASINRKFDVPAALEGCHTMVAGPYVFEGLIPAEYVKQVLNERRPVRGLSLPGMPSGAPGMPGLKNGPLNVYYLGNESPPRVFARF